MCLMLYTPTCLQLAAQDVHQQLALQKVGDGGRIDGAGALLNTRTAPIGAIAQALYAAQQPAEEEPIPAPAWSMTCWLLEHAVCGPYHAAHGTLRGPERPNCASFCIPRETTASHFWPSSSPSQGHDRN